MSTYLAPSARAYRQNAVLTATPAQLVVMLYDGATRFLAQAAIATRERNVPLAHEKLRRAENVIEHLRATLDLSQGDVAVRLDALYTFYLRRLGESRVERDAERIEWVAEMLGRLRHSWAQLAEAV